MLHSAISVDLEIKGLEIVLKDLNVYNPYTDRRAYCESLADSRALESQYILLGGDL